MIHIEERDVFCIDRHSRLIEVQRTVVTDMESVHFFKKRNRLRVILLRGISKASSVEDVSLKASRKFILATKRLRRSCRAYKF